MENTSPDTVVLYDPTWHAATQLSKHHLNRYWARNRRVLDVDNPPNPLSFGTRRRDEVSLWKRYRHGPIKVAERLWLHTYLYPLPYRGSFIGLGGRWVNNFNQMVSVVSFRGAFNIWGSTELCC